MTFGLRRSAGLFVVVLALVVALPSAAVAIDATDPRRAQLWWFDTLGVEAAWDVSQGQDVVVAVLDTGVDTTHPDLQGQLVEVDGTFGRDFIDDGAMFDPNGHGTIVSGLVAAAANNDVGVAGVAPAARVLPVRVLDSEGRGDAATVDAGIRWAVDNGADVINLSLEVEETEDGPDPTLTAPNAAIEYAWENGVVVIAATGNSGGGAAGYREGSPVVLVGASEREDERAAFSDAERLDAVMAPGVEMVSTWCQPRGGGCNTEERARYGIGNGTSFSAPVAAGVVALLLGSGLDHAAAVEVLRDTAVDLGPEGPDLTFGVGRIDAAAALGAGAERAAAPQPAPSTPAPSPTDGTSPGVAGAGDDAVADLPEGTDATEAPAEDVTDPDRSPPADAPTNDELAAPIGEPIEESGPLGLVAAALLVATFAATWLEARGRRDG